MRGFTLIETLIYAVLISVTLGMVLLAVYQMIEGRYRIAAMVEVEEESRFVMAKINWALNGVDAVIQPAADATSSVLSVNKLDFSPNPVTIQASGTDAFISYGEGEPIILNSESVLIKDLTFRHFNEEEAPAVEVSFVVEYRPREQLTIYYATTSLRTTIYARKQ